MDKLTERLSKCYASAVHDVLREKGFENCVLPPEIQALKKGEKIVWRGFHYFWSYRLYTFKA